MHKYFIRIPWIIKAFFLNYVWHIPTKEKEVYLTFDDGPHPDITGWVLDQLRRYNALATFFCIGNNVRLNPTIYQQILDGRHAVGNHTYNHLNGWHTTTEEYIKNIELAREYIQSHLFRPPYGRIKRKQAKQVAGALKSATAKIIMWDVLSADFDTSISPEQCLLNVMKNVRPGSVIVFHDSEKAFTNLKFVLPKVLDALQKEGYAFKAIE